MIPATTDSNLHENLPELGDFYDDLECTCAESIFKKCLVCESDDLETEFQSTDTLELDTSYSEPIVTHSLSTVSSILDSVERLSEMFSEEVEEVSLEDDPFYASYADNQLAQDSDEELLSPDDDYAEDSEPEDEYIENEFYTREQVVAIRAALSKKLAGMARFTELRPGTKVPVSRFDDDSTYDVAPEIKDYGVVPKKNLLILDIDSHGGTGTTVSEQIELFSELLGVDLRTTFNVATPSGGIHSYLLIPEDRKQLPVGIHNLKAYSDAIGKILGRPVHVDADLRSGRSSGYAVGPTSAFVRLETDPETGLQVQIREIYRIADESDGFSAENANADLQFISDLGFQRLASLRSIKKEMLDDSLRARREERARRKAEAKKVSVGQLEEAIREFPVADKSSQTDAMPAPEFVRKLQREMNLRKMVTFHQRRSFVKAALHCCHSDTAIAQVCIDLDIDRDSGTKSEISYSDLLSDLARFSPTVSYHGGYCSRSRQSSRPSATDFVEEGRVFTVEELREKNAKKVAERSISRHKPGYRSPVNPRVLNVSAISSRLLEGSKRKTPSQQYFDAMRVVDYFLQPLSNVGARVVILARTALEQRLELSPSRAAQAVRILRQKGIISVVDKQRTGLSATYAIDEMFTHPRLTKTLRMLWGFNGVVISENDDKKQKFHAAIYLDRFDGVFREVFTEKIVESDFPSVALWLHEMTSAVSIPDAENVGPGAALSYLKSEAETRGIKVVSGPDPILIEENTGEIVSSGPELRNEKLTERFGKFSTSTAHHIDSDSGQSDDSLSFISTNDRAVKRMRVSQSTDDPSPP